MVKLSGAAHVKPKATRKHAEGTRSVDKGAAEAAGQADEIAQPLDI